MTTTGPLEIERKFLLDGVPPIPAGSEVVRLVQGYLADAPDGVEGRLRRSEHADGTVRYMHTIKRGEGLVREESEREIDASEFDERWPFTGGARLRKHRHRVPDGALTWEVDVFDDIDLVLAEVELPTPETPAPIPGWLAGHVVREVTNERAYGNYTLARQLGVGTPNEG